MRPVKETTCGGEVFAHEIYEVSKIGLRRAKSKVVNLLRICIKPPQRGHFHVAVAGEAANGGSVAAVSMRSSRRMSVRLWERSRFTVFAKNVGHLDGGPAHSGLRNFRERCKRSGPETGIFSSGFAAAC